MTARGIRNNNPGNLRHGSDWNGLSAEQTDTAFCQFDCATYGIRALVKLLLVYQSKYGLKTVKDIINRYAPPIENDTGAYARAVSRELGVDESGMINLSDPVVMAPMVEAIIVHENGSCPYDYEISDGMTLAGLV